MERLTPQFVFKGQMAAEGLWKPEPEPKHRYLKLLPGAAGAPGFNVVQGAALWQVWPDDPLLFKF